MRHLWILIAIAACSDPPTFSNDPIDGGVDDASDVTGNFTLTVAKQGNGTVASTAGITCGDTCTAELPAGTFVTLTAEPAIGATFAGWGGPCTGAVTTCAFTITADTDVSAEFAVAMHTVAVELAGNGTGRVVSSTGGLDCPGACTVSVPYGTPMTLTATATSSTFLGFSGGTCAGTGACSFTVTGDAVVDAAFALDQTLVVTRAGTGTGTVTSAPGGINCGTDCSQVYGAGTQVTLTATPAASSTFTGWSGGGCSGTGTCVVTVNAAVTVSATFTLRQYTLTAATAGGGSGVIASSPTGISCPTDCTQSFAHGTSVTLTATPSASSLFTGWAGGGCSGTASCTVTITAATTVTATFAPLFVVEPEVGLNGPNGRVSLGAAANRVCFLSGVTGQFAIDGGDAHVLTDGGEWVLTAVGLIDAYAQCISWPAASNITTEPESGWTQGDAPNHMGLATNRFCGLSRMAGKFQGGGELIHAYVSADRWYLGGTSGGALGITAGARCITWPASTPLSYSGEHLWSQAFPAVDLGPLANRACAFTLLAGSYQGLEELAYVRRGSSSWLLGGKSLQAGVASRARCLTSP